MKVPTGYIDKNAEDALNAYQVGKKIAESHRKKKRVWNPKKRCYEYKAVK